MARSTWRTTRLNGSVNDDTIIGYDRDDRLSGNYGDDTLRGGRGNDRLNGDRGNDVLEGGDGNDVLISRSDAGEAVIAQEVNANNDPNGEVDAATRMIYANQAGLPGDDILTGGRGADEFRIETLINAKREILEKHADPRTGIIDYHAVAGENNLVHDHWVDSIGNDVITDFNKAEGDKITIKGHTTEVYKIEMADVDGDGDFEDDIHVRVDGAVVPQSSHGFTRWTYVEGANRIQFHSWSVPEPESTVEVTYTPSCLGTPH